MSVEQSVVCWAVHSDVNLAVPMVAQSVVTMVVDLVETMVYQKAGPMDDVSAALTVVSTADWLVAYLAEHSADQLADCWVDTLVDRMAGMRDK